MRANLPSSRYLRPALGRPATFVTAAWANRIMETEQSAEKKLEEFNAKVFGISLAAVFLFILILDAASSSTRTYSDHDACQAEVRDVKSEAAYGQHGRVECARSVYSALP
jgi:hypothetical protein